MNTDQDRTPEQIAMDEVVASAAAAHTISSLEDAVSQVMTAYRDLGFSRPNDDVPGTEHSFRCQIFNVIALRMFDGDTGKAGSYFSGYFFFRDASGNEIGPLDHYDVDAWEAGRAASPDYPFHQEACKLADTALAERFRPEHAGSRKAHRYWMRSYVKAFASITKRTLVGQDGSWEIDLAER